MLGACATLKVPQALDDLCSILKYFSNSCYFLLGPWGSLLDSSNGTSFHPEYPFCPIGLKYLAERAPPWTTYEDGLPTTLAEIQYWLLAVHPLWWFMSGPLLVRCWKLLYWSFFLIISPQITYQDLTDYLWSINHKLGTSVRLLSQEASLRPVQTTLMLER